MADSLKQAQFIQLRAEGKSFTTISEEIGVSKPTLIKWSRELEVDIINAKALEVDSLREHYFPSKKRKLTILHKALEKMERELTDRDYSDIATDKLFALFAATKSSLDEELAVKLVEIETIEHILEKDLVTRIV